MYAKILSIVFIFSYLISAQEAIREYNPTRLIVKFSESSDIYRTIRQIPVLNYSDKIEIEGVIDKPEVFSFFNEYKISSIKPAKLSASEASLAVEINKIYFFDFQNNEALEKSLVRLRLLTDFDYVEYDWIISGNGYEIPSGLNPESILPNDPGFGNQWGLRNTGQNIGGITGSPGADINITSAWDFTTGNSSTIISVLDSGIPLAAAEFNGRILPGYDFANNNNGSWINFINVRT